MATVHETWNSFWGPLLLLRFHDDNPDRWAARETRARALWVLLGLAEGDRVVDLGCGDGVLDTCLARLGARVIGVDRIGSVLQRARTEAGEAPVEFRTGDVRSVTFPPSSLSAVLMLELLGLMDRAAEEALFDRIRTWLRPGGALLVDTPLEPESPSFAWTREFPDGLLEVEGTYDRESRTQSMDLRFVRQDGTVIDLVDPYDPARGSHAGVRRRLAPPEELLATLQRIGFDVSQPDRPENERANLILAKA